MTLEQALAALGVNSATLTEEEASALDRDGFVRLRGVLSAAKLEALRGRLAELLEREGKQAGSETYTEPGAACLADLVNKGSVFHVVLTEPRVLAAVGRVLRNDFRLSSLNSRFALPGHGNQHLHADWDEAYEPGDFQVCNSIWLLDDFTAENGATRAVPGTHRRAARPQDEMKDPGARHPDELLLLGGAGDVFVFNAHTWHGGTKNQSDRARRAMHGYFCRRHVTSQLDQQKFVRWETWEALSPAARVVLGVEAPTVARS